MLYGVYLDKETNEYHGGVYDTWEQWYHDTFSPCCETVTLFEMKVRGKTYAQKKAAAEDQAIEYTNTCGLIPMSWGEVIAIGHYFSWSGKRYGLLREFRENGVC